AGTRPPGRGSPRRSRCTAWNTPSPPVRSRSRPRPPSHLRTLRCHEACVFTPVTRSVRNGRSPRVLAAALAVALPRPPVRPGPGQAGGDAVWAGRAAAGPVSRSRAPAPAKRPTTIRAVKLLAQAAQSAIVTSYQGREILTRWSQGGGSVLVSSIWHVSGGQTV